MCWQHSVLISNMISFFIPEFSTSRMGDFHVATSGGIKVAVRDPKKSDTDGDGMPDGWEVTYGLNPLVKDGGDDLDQDGYTNLQEYQAGTNPDDRHSVPHAGSKGAPWLIPLLLDH